MRLCTGKKMGDIINFGKELPAFLVGGACPDDDATYVIKTTDPVAIVRFPDGSDDAEVLQFTGDPDDMERVVLECNEAWLTAFAEDAEDDEEIAACLKEMDE